jgi:hypothetical protein
MEPQPQKPATSTTDPLAALDRRNLWVVGLAVDDDGGIVGPGLGRYSFWADCECPDDCLRDHENE